MKKLTKWEEWEKLLCLAHTMPMIALSGRKTEEAERWRKDLKRSLTRRGLWVYDGVNGPNDEGWLKWLIGKSLAMVLVADGVVAHNQLGIVSATEVALAYALGMEVWRENLPEDRILERRIKGSMIPTKLIDMSMKQLCLNQANRCRKKGYEWPNLNQITPCLREIMDQSIRDLIHTYTADQKGWGVDDWIIMARLKARQLVAE